MFNRWLAVSWGQHPGRIVRHTLHSVLGSVSVALISLVPMREGGGHILKDFKGEEEKMKRKTAGGGRDQITTFYSKEKGCN